MQLELAVLLLAGTSCVCGLPGGPPLSVCEPQNLLRPNHPSGTEVTTNNGGYIITTNLTINDDSTGYIYEAGQTYRG